MGIPIGSFYLHQFFNLHLPNLNFCGTVGAHMDFFWSTH